MIFLLMLAAQSADGNRLAYLDENDPYYVHRKFPKLTTPQWVGEEGVEAVVVLAIDDMRGHEKWEAYLRPILERLKKIDGRAPVSIMTCTIDPNHPHLQKWLKEGLSIEVHTVDHPHPLLQGGDLVRAKSTYDRCVDLMNLIPNNRPVAFRMPYCDSLNTPSPRFYSEIFNKTTPHGNCLAIDTSVFNITTASDPDLPKELTTDPDGKEKFRKFIPFPSFVNTIQDYPYPYVIGKLCWEFPCAVPSDWEAQNILKPFNPQTVADMKAAIDAVVLKQGVFNFVFHPHGWIKAEQVVELIDHAVEKHGNKVKFLTFREALERINKNLLAGSSLRRPDGSDDGIRILDVDGDGYMDVVSFGNGEQRTRLWNPATRGWRKIEAVGHKREPRFGLLDKGTVGYLEEARFYAFRGDGWTSSTWGGGPEFTIPPEARFRDLDGDGSCEILTNGAIYARTPGKTWTKLPFTLPVPLTDGQGYDSGLRFVDLNGDGRPDIVYSNDREWSIYVFRDMTVGWEKVSGGKHGEDGATPMIVRNGTDNGAWFHSRHLWIQNEDTAKMPDHVDRRSFEDLLRRR